MVTLSSYPCLQRLNKFQIRRKEFSRVSRRRRQNTDLMPMYRFRAVLLAGKSRAAVATKNPRTMARLVMTWTKSCSTLSHSKFTTRNKSHRELSFTDQMKIRLEKIIKAIKGPSPDFEEIFEHDF